MNLLNWLRTVSGAPRPITRKEMGRLDAAALLRRSRAMAKFGYVGNDTVLCRALTRYRLFVAADDVGFGAPVMLDGVWENWLTAFMAQRIKPGMAVVDAGANHGYYTLLFAHLTGKAGRVAAIEPHPRTAALLRKSVYANNFQSWVQVVEQAGGAEDGVIQHLNLPDHEPKNAHLSISPAPEGRTSVPVVGARLATILAGWPRIDFIKADVEGAEEAFIEGAWPIIERDRPMLVLEFNAGRCADPKVLLDRLEALYGRLRVVTADHGLVERPRTMLEDRDRRQDWILYLEH